MAGLRFRSVPVAFATGSAVKTMIQFLAPANQCVKIGELSMSFNGTSNTNAPIYVETVKQTSAGTLTNTTTLVKEDAARAETIQTTGKDTATAEPTDSGAVTLAEYVHPQTGFLWQAPFGGEQFLTSQASSPNRLGFRQTAANSVNAALRFVAEE